MWRSDQLDLAGLQRLKRDADVLAGRLTAAAEAAAGEFTGRDPGNVVELTVGEDGTPTRMDLDSQWRRTVGDRGLGRAIVVALADAASARLTVWAEHAAAEAGDPPVPDPGPALADLGDPSSRQSMHALRDLFDLIGETTAGLRELSEAAGHTSPVTSANLSRTVRVTAVDGEVSDVDFDELWLRTAAPQRISDAVQEALAASVRDVAAARQARIGAVPGLGRVRQLIESPETLLREIGLLR